MNKENKIEIKITSLEINILHNIIKNKMDKNIEFKSSDILAYLSDEIKRDRLFAYLSEIKREVWEKNNIKNEAYALISKLTIGNY